MSEGEVMKLGGTMILHNPLKYDYCVREALISLLRVCDEVVVLDCESTDGTHGSLAALKLTYPHLRIFPSAWALADNYERLSILTNNATNKLSSDVNWVLNLQADEVLDDDINQNYLFRLIANADSLGCDGFAMQRVNLWGGFEHHFPDDYPNKPVSNTVVRLVKRGCKSVRDAESFECKKVYKGVEFELKMFHYGFLRKPDIMLKKILDMQEWFGFGQDKKAIEQLNTTGVFDPEAWHPKEKLEEIYFEHPRVMENWIQERWHYYGN